jgi:hypothetical protein
MTLDLDKLEQLARAAAPSPWKLITEVGDDDVLDRECYLIVIGDADEDNLITESWHRPSAEYIAAMSPDVALEMIAELKQSRAKLAEVAKIGRMLKEEDIEGLAKFLGVEL